MPSTVHERIQYHHMCFSLKPFLIDRLLLPRLLIASFLVLKCWSGIFSLKLFFPWCTMESSHRISELFNNPRLTRWAHCKHRKCIWKYLILWPMTHSLTLILLYKGLMYWRINMLSDIFYITEFLCWSVFSLLTTYVSNIPSTSSSIWIYSLILVLIVTHYSKGHL